MDEQRIWRTLRYMAANRALGELRSMLSAYWDSGGEYSRESQVIKECIEKIEGLIR